MSEQPHDPASGAWHWDKRIPVAIVGAILIQTFGMGYWAANLSSRITTLEEAGRISSGQDARIVRVETQVQSIQRTLDRIDTKLDRIIQGAPNER